jgi:hypothetical protein
MKCSWCGTVTFFHWNTTPKNSCTHWNAMSNEVVVQIMRDILTKDKHRQSGEGEIQHKFHRGALILEKVYWARDSIWEDGLKRSWKVGWSMVAWARAIIYCFTPFHIILLWFLEFRMKRVTTLWGAWMLTPWRWMAFWPGSYPTLMKLDWCRSLEQAIPGWCISKRAHGLFG